MKNDLTAANRNSVVVNLDKFDAVRDHRYVACVVQTKLLLVSP